MVTAERHRLQAMRSPAVRRLIQAHVDWLTTQLHELEQELRHAIEASPIWQAQRDLLCSVPGIGPTLAAVLVERICPSWGRCLPNIWRPWSGELRSTRMRGPTVATGSSGVGELAFERRWTWRLWWPPATIPSCGRSTSVCCSGASPRKSRLRRVCRSS